LRAHEHRAGDHGSEVSVCLCKIMGNQGLVDNFAGGKYVNLAAGVD
jgi:hypothetical protein